MSSKSVSKESIYNYRLLSAASTYDISAFTVYKFDISLFIPTNIGVNKSVN